MSISDSIKNKYHQMKDSLRASIFSKNKSVIRISQFSKRSTINKILTFTSINMFICLPYFIWFGSVGKIAAWLGFIIPSFAFTFLVTNTLFFGTLKLLSLIFRKNKNKQDNNSVGITSLEKKPQEHAQYFGKGFIEGIREFFIAAGSVATTFVPFLIMTNILLLSYYLNNQTYFGVNSQFFSNFVNYLRIDSVLIVLLTTLTTGSIYGVKFILFLKRIFLKGLDAQKQTNSSDLPQSQNNYTPQRSFPVEDFIPSLSKEFKKTYNINTSEELKASAEVKKD